MNTRHEHAWHRLIVAARRAPDGGPDSAPLGFSSRVAALAAEDRRPRLSLAEAISLKAMIVAGALAVVVTAANYALLARLFQDEPQANDDPVAELLEVGS